ncbi:abc-type tungstate transport system, permease protein [hydrocarbon metagenome]|uniref:Abc-type tungstate transport system, permease protein n=1 Tax=hydrocarbon metagenome TaxID=938273 RepID=A0A0W8E1H1_9ZZZZ
MDIILHGVKEGLGLIISLDPDLIQVTLLSIQVSLTALLIAGILGIPAGTFLALKDFYGRKLLLNLTYTLMGLPPVLAGLIVFLFLSNRGPLGEFQLLFTPGAMIIAQVLLGFPLVAGLTARSVMTQRQEVYDTSVMLGATRSQAVWTIIRESRIGIIAALTTALGRLIAEVGAVMMVGGNIQGKTRVLTTSIVLETRMGNDSRALGIGIILLILAFIIMLIILKLEKRSFKDDSTIQII